MIDLGDIPLGITLPIFFDTYDSNGASVTMTGIAVTDVEAYKGTSMTQRSSDNGYALIDTDGIDLDSTTGLQGFSIDFTDNSDAGFWAAGSIYHVNLNSITVDSQTVRHTWRFRLVTAENTSGTRVVDVGRINNVSTSSVTTVNANVGTTQPLNFTGTGSSAYVKSDVIQFGSSNGTFSGGRPEVNTTYFGGTLQQTGKNVSQLVNLLANAWKTELSVPAVIEVPSSSTRTYRIEITMTDATGAPVDDSSGGGVPIVSLINQAGTSLASRLGSVSWVSTGRYRVIYTSTAGDADAGLIWSVVTEYGGNTQKAEAASVVQAATISNLTVTVGTNNDKTGYGLSGLTDSELKRVLSMASGRVAKSGDTYTYYASDDSTALFTLTISATERTPDLTP